LAAVSPWQFKDIDANDAWVEQGDTLWNYRWLQAIQTVKPDIVEIGVSPASSASAASTEVRNPYVSDLE
jgi:hypothetical protein